MSRADEVLAEVAVDALLAEAELTPKPGLPDAREADFGALRWSARSLTPGLTAMAAAARRAGGEPGRGLRRELGAIGRCTERTMARANAGSALHHGAVWPLGLLVSAAALAPTLAPDRLPTEARRLAALPDGAAPRIPSPGSAAASRYGAAGARGEARAGFPHVRRALTALRTARAAGAREPEARLDALLTVMSTLQDTGLLHAAGPHGLREAQNGAREVLEAGGVGSARGGAALHALDVRLRADGLRPRGSAHLLAGALFLDILRDRSVARAARPTALAA
ncbi:triphosphoribosyl-dephospho-CoA synthase [Streptomyces corynorhini]|uniref:triphosphoribosyl-dephospho-CoA synthase n=1 Tax=Streptomyces corynorhini TaxID=2282652 RepID=A0A370B7T2_9ACTN|nr:triphosphoribosyl-dephospho-CoA synthase [Streptomyces corynorhini]RDG37860.1 2-(5'-triphosphoribosyl)-3'-dephospho CoA synthase [Streptomyces corynorhini]